MASTPPESPVGQLSPDGKWRWDGMHWVPAETAPPPPGPPAAPPFPTAPPYAAGQQYPAGPPFAPARPAATGLAFQFSGDALWSIIFGLASVLVPIFTPIYFPILPIFGLWRGVLAIRRGRIAGGVIGLVVSGLGCIVSLLSSGLIH
jgi:hypothetical protein